MKMRMCLIVGIIILLVVIIVPSGECIQELWTRTRSLHEGSRCNEGEINVLTPDTTNIPHNNCVAADGCTATRRGEWHPRALCFMTPCRNYVYDCLGARLDFLSFFAFERPARDAILRHHAWTALLRYDTLRAVSGSWGRSQWSSNALHSSSCP